jgi:hypothetical protein
MLVTPGLIFELLRRRARPKIERSAFEEISVVVVTSMLFASIGLGVVFLMSLAGQTWFVDLSAWMMDGLSYAADHLPAVVLTLGLAWFVACASAVGLHLVLCSQATGPKVARRLGRSLFSPGDGPRVSPNPAIYDVLLAHDEGVKRRIVSVELGDARNLTGVLHRVDDDFVFLKAPYQVQQPGHQTFIVDGGWDAVGVPLDDVQLLSVKRVTD